MTTYQERVARAHAAYRRPDWGMKINVDLLRREMFTDGIIPKDRDGWEIEVSVPMSGTGPTSRIIANVLVKRSKSVGDKKCRGGRGHRLFIQCPACAAIGINNPIPVGRLPQHYGYKHD